MRRLAVGIVAACALIAMASPAGAADTGKCQDSGYRCLAQYGYSGQSTWGSAHLAHNCVSYVAYRLAQSGAVQPWSPIGNGGKWANGAAARTAVGDPYRVDNIPTAGSVWESSSMGHVAYVDAVDASSVYISEDNFNGGSSRRVLSRNALGDAHFIHIRDARYPKNGDANGDGIVNVF